MCCPYFLVILSLCQWYLQRECLTVVRHGLMGWSIHPFSSTCPTVCLPLFCWEVNNRPAVVHCSCGPHVDCSGNSLLEHRLGSAIRWATERERDGEVQTVPFNTDTRTRAEKRGRQAGRLIKIPQVQSTQPVAQCNGSGGSAPHYTVVKRNIPIDSND